MMIGIATALALVLAVIVLVRARTGASVDLAAVGPDATAVVESDDSARRQTTPPDDGRLAETRTDDRADERADGQGSQAADAGADATPVSTPTPAPTTETEAAPAPPGIAPPASTQTESAAPRPAAATPKPEAPATPTPTAATPEEAATPPAPTPQPAGDQEDFPDGSELPAAGGSYPIPPTLPANFVPTLPAIPDVPETPAPVPAPLNVLPSFPPTSEPLPTPPPVPLGPLDDGALGLSSNAFGCKARCITSAVLLRNLQNADVGFDVQTNVQTTHALWVLPAGPAVVNGLPVHVGKPPRAVNQDPSTSWSGTVTGLSHDTMYRVVLTAADTQGNFSMATTLFTTASEPVADLVAPGSPCVFECLTSALVTPGPTFDRAQIRVETTDTATIEIAISPSEPGTIAGNPFLPNDVVITGLTKDGGTYNANIFDLEPNTTYHVVVKAIDAEGAAQYATGSFVSLPPPPPPPPPVYAVVTWIDRFHIHQDGDSVGRGEISFRYGMPDPGDPFSDYVWQLPFQKLGEGETVDAGGYRSVHVLDGEPLPPVIVNARESDHVSNSCGFEVGAPLLTESADGRDPRVCSKETVTAAVLRDITVDFIATLPSCETWNVNGSNPGDRCYVLRSQNVAEDFVDFGALIVFRVFES